MTIPNVTITWCQRKAVCQWCEQPIEAGTALVKVFFWNKGDDGSRNWNTTQYYHFPACYSAQGLDYLSRNPYVAKHKGNVSKLSPEDRKKRYLLVRRFNELVQRKREIKLPYPNSVPLEMRLNDRMVEVMMEMASLGGIPKRWVEKLS